jgi:hypothetical protein
MKRKVFFYILILLTDFLTSWTHTDPAYCKFGFSLCVNRTEDISSSTSPGASFVDVDLRVAVLQSPGTALAFQPARLHGTTIGQGARNHNIAISFSKRVADAWKEATETERKVIAGEGAGPPA